jgi:hypothetical protein
MGVDTKADFEGPSAEAEPKVGVGVVELKVFALFDMGVKGDDGVVCSGFLKKGEVLGVVLPNAPKPTAG